MGLRHARDIGAVINKMKKFIKVIVFAYFCGFFLSFAFTSQAAYPGCMFPADACIRSDGSTGYCGDIAENICNACKPSGSIRIYPGRDYECCSDNCASINFTECECRGADIKTKAATTEASSEDNGMPKLQMPIPNVKFQPAIKCTTQGDENKLCVNWIAEYIAGIYKYAIGIVGILATIVMMIGGVMWMMSGGNASTAGEAKSWITSSLTGLVIALCSYMILYQVNPALVLPTGLKLQIVKPVPEEGDNSSRSITTGDIAGINIPSGTVGEVVNNMIGKYTYSQEKRLTSADGNNYIDCSSFVCIVLVKSGQTAPNPAACTTASLFTGSPQETNLAAMPAGIVVGYPPSASTNGAGHAWISMSDGRFANARGGTEGRQPGNSITIVSASQVTATMAKYGVSGPYIMTK